MAEVWILRSFDDTERRIAGLSTTILLLWLAAMCVGLGLTYLLARRIVEPVKQLDRAAAEMARQNYAIEVGVRAEDEMGRLAQTFNTMCASIRHAREEPDSSGAYLYDRPPFELDRPRFAQSPGRHLRRRRDAGGRESGSRSCEATGRQHLPRLATHPENVAGSAQRLLRQERGFGTLPPGRRLANHWPRQPNRMA